MSKPNASAAASTASTWPSGCSCGSRGGEEAATAAGHSLADAAAYHLAEGGYVDWARLSLRGGDPVRELSEAYARLFTRVTAVREQQARHFAALLRDWTAAGSSGDGMLPVERILDEIVAPLAAQAPVLVIVVDGMSAAVCQELVADLTRQDWLALCEQGRAANRPGLAALPSITEVSRTSLLCGQLRQGECRGGEKGVCRASRAPGALPQRGRARLVPQSVAPGGRRCQCGRRSP